MICPGFAHPWAVTADYEHGLSEASAPAQHCLLYVLWGGGRVPMRRRWNHDINSSAYCLITVTPSRVYFYRVTL